MEKEKFSVEKSREKEPEEVSRYELDPRENTSVVIRILKNVRVPEPWEEMEYKPLQIVLQKDNKDIFDFNELLPQGYKIVSLGTEMEKELRREEVGGALGIWECDEKEKFVIIPPIWDEGSKDILSLLHEIGHSLDKTQPEKNKKISQYSKIIEEIGLRPAVDEKQKNYLRQVQKQYLRLVAQLERYAWAKALMIARTLKKKEGIDLLKPFQGKTPKETKENLENYIHGVESLGCSERFNIAQSDLVKELKGIFTTKFYKGEKFTLEHRRKIRR